MTRSKALQEFQQIPGVGIRIAEDLWNLGFCKCEDLRSEDPQVMYDRLCELQGSKVDRCMLYVFRCAIYYVREKKPKPELLKWWNWSDQNLAKHGNEELLSNFMIGAH